MMRCNMWQPDKSGSLPLTTAIACKNLGFIKTLLDCTMDEPLTTMFDLESDMRLLEAFSQVFAPCSLTGFDQRQHAVQSEDLFPV